MIRCSEATKRDIEEHIKRTTDEIQWLEAQDSVYNFWIAMHGVHFWREILKDIVIDNTIERDDIMWNTEDFE